MSENEAAVCGMTSLDRKEVCPTYQSTWPKQPRASSLDYSARPGGVVAVSRRTARAVDRRVVRVPMDRVARRPNGQGDTRGGHDHERWVQVPTAWLVREKHET